MNNSFIKKIMYYTMLIFVFTMLCSCDNKMLPKYYSLTDVKGKNYVTSLKDQESDTSLCWAYSTVAFAETYLLKNHKDYVKDTLKCEIFDDSSKVNYKEFKEKELNLSEAYNAITMFNQPKDRLSISAKSRNLPSDKYSSFMWKKVSINDLMVSMNLSTWRSIILEDDLYSLKKNKNKLYSLSIIEPSVKEKYIDAYSGNVILGVKSAIIHNFMDYVIRYDDNDKYKANDDFVYDLKKSIIEHDGAILFVRYNHYSMKEYEKINSTDYGMCRVYYMDDLYESNYDSHSVYVIGYDDDIIFDDGKKKGAFICKDSANTFSLVPYDFNFITYDDKDENAISSYLDISWFLLNTDYDNNYFYDSGYSDYYFKGNERIIKDTDYKNDKYIYANPQYESIANIFKMKNDEVLKAVSYFSLLNDDRVRLTIYELEDDSIKSFGDNDKKVLYKKECDLSLGANCITIDKNIVVKKDRCVAIVLQTLNYPYIVASIDSAYNKTSDFQFISEYKGKSFIGDVNSDSLYAVVNSNDDTVVDEKDYDDEDKMRIEEIKNRINANYNWIDLKDYLGELKKGNLRIKLYTKVRR